MRLQTSAALAALAFATSLSAQVSIVTWDASSLSGVSTSLSATTANSSVTGLAITRGSGLAGVSSSGAFNSSGWTGESTDFVSFGFTVDSGLQIDLSSLTISGRSSGTGPGTLGLFVSTDSFATSVATFTQNTTSNLDYNFDLSGLTSLTGTVEFRIFAVGTTAENGSTTSSGGTFRIQNPTGGTIEFLGNVSAADPVPEPATIALLAGLVAGLVAIRRRKST